MCSENEKRGTLNCSTFNALYRVDRPTLVKKENYDFKMIFEVFFIVVLNATTTVHSCNKIV